LRPGYCGYGVTSEPSTMFLLPPRGLNGW